MDYQSDIATNIDDIVLESELNTMSCILDAYDKELSMWKNGSGGYFQEASGNKPNLFQRFWNLIKSALKKLLKVIRWIGKKIRSLFKKGKQSMDQIVERCHIKPKRKVIHEAAVDAPDKEKEVVIHFPASKDSFLTETDLHVAVKHLYLKIIDNKFVASVPGIQSNVSFRGPHRTSNWDVNYYAACAIIEETELNELLFDTAEMIIFDKSANELIDIEEGFIDNVNRLDQRAYDPKNATKYKNNIPFNNRDFVNFQQQLSDVTAKIDKVHTIEGISDELLEALNKFADILIGVAFGMNEFNRSVNQLYMIDTQYIAAVNRASDLDAFVFDCIKHGIHPKFIAYNAWLLLDDAWKTDHETFYTKDIRPKWGQTRTVFDIKGVNVVAKIAMSGVGIMGNRNEIAITKEFKQHNVDDVLACVEESMQNAAVIFPKAILSIMKPDSNDLFEYKERLEDIYWDYPDLHDIRGDIHIGNIGFDTSRHVVCIDYGNSPITKR